MVYRMSKSTETTITPGKDLAIRVEGNGMKSTKSQASNTIQIGVQSWDKKGILMSKTEAAAVSFTPNPDLTIHQQCRVEQATGDPHLHPNITTTTTRPIRRMRTVVMGEAARGWIGKAERGREEDGGEWGRVEANLLGAAAELARGAAAPGE